jgi:hypothetical protein
VTLVTLVTLLTHSLPSPARARRVVKQSPQSHSHRLRDLERVEIRATKDRASRTRNANRSASVPNVPNVPNVLGRPGEAGQFCRASVASVGQTKRARQTPFGDSCDSLLGRCNGCLTRCQKRRFGMFSAVSRFNRHKTQSFTREMSGFDRVSARTQVDVSREHIEFSAGNIAMGISHIGAFSRFSL